MRNPNTEPIRPRKKRTKNAPDKPQPERMFPTDEENPILNPKPGSEKQKRKDAEVWNESIKFLQYKSVSAPMKAPPPGQLCSLVGAFLTIYGFNSTSRIYSTELASRKKLAAWELEIGAKLPKGIPGLVEIYEDWYKEYQKKTQDDQTRSHLDNRTMAAARTKEQGDGLKLETDNTSSSGSSSDDSGSDVEMRDAVTADSAKKISKSKMSTSATSSSSSDSDADDEKEASGAKLSFAKPSVNGTANKLKRKASLSGSSSSDSSSHSLDASFGKVEPPKKKSKGTTNETPKSGATDANFPSKTKASEKPSTSPSSSSNDSSDEDSTNGKVSVNGLSSASSSDDTSSSNGSDAVTEAKKTQIAKLANESVRTSTDSSATLEDHSLKRTSTSNTSTSATSSSSTESSHKGAVLSTKKHAKRRKHSPSLPAESQSPAFNPSKATKIAKKQQNEPFSRIPKDTVVDAKLASNAYRSYDYADRAHQDLSVTKGKGFTKEKNKKKRGSYRGGMIDVDGRKGIKFDD